MLSSLKYISIVLAIIGLISLLSFRNDGVNMENGISIGNALDAPKGKDWGVTMENSLLDYIKEQGFDTVRLPIRFSDYIDENYMLDEEFMQEIDGYIEYALSIDLIIIIDMHHFVELVDAEAIDEDKNLPDDFDYERAFYEMWEQISIRYKEMPKELVFEILNEPKDDITPEKWNEMVAKTISIIRETNETRKIIVSTARTAIVEAFDDLVLPKDNNLIVTFHYYTPLEFAFQNDENHSDYELDGEIHWLGSEEDLEELEKKFKIASDFAKENNVEVLLGEFGVVKTAPRESRIKWTEDIVKMAKKYDFSYTYWELGHNFGIFDLETGEWDEEMVSVLLDKED